MNYNDALMKIIKDNGLDILKRRFITRSILSDYIKNQYQDKKLIDVLYCIYEHYDLVEIFEQHGLKNGRIFLKEKYNVFSEKFTIADYKNAINPISKYMFPNEYEETYIKNEDVVVNVIKDKNNKGKIKISNQNMQKNIDDIKQPNKNNKIKNIEIETSDNSIYVKRTSKNRIEIYNGNVLMDLKKFPITNNTLKIDLKNIKYFDKIYIYIPHKNYDVLSINCNSSDSFTKNLIDISLSNVDFSINEYYFKKIEINGYYKTMNFRGVCNEAVINANGNNSKVLIESKLNKLSINILKGELIFNVSPRLQKDMNIFIRANKLKIKGSFSKEKLNKRVKYTLLSKHPIVIKDNYNFYSHKVYIDIKTIKGSVSLR